MVSFHYRLTRGAQIFGPSEILLWSAMHWWWWTFNSYSYCGKLYAYYYSCLLIAREQLRHTLLSLLQILQLHLSPKTHLRCRSHPPYFHLHRLQLLQLMHTLLELAYPLQQISLQGQSSKVAINIMTVSMLSFSYTRNWLLPLQSVGVNDTCANVETSWVFWAF